MRTTNLLLPKVVTRAEWLPARLELLAKEKELTHRRDTLNAERRRLPMLRIEKDYVFEGPDGKASLLDLFEGRLQLIIYHFMWLWEAGQPLGQGVARVLSLCRSHRQRSSHASARPRHFPGPRLPGTAGQD